MQHEHHEPLQVSDSMPIDDETQLLQNPCTSANLSDSYEEVSLSICESLLKKLPSYWQKRLHTSI